MAFEMPNTIQPQEYSRGGEMDETFYISDGDPNVLNTNRNDDGRWLNTNWDHPDNQWNDNGAFAFLVPETLFISLLSFHEESFVYPELAEGVLQSAHSIHQAFCRSHPVLLKE